MEDNVYYDAIKNSIEKLRSVLADGKVSLREALGLVMLIQSEATAIIQQQPFTDEDCEQLALAVQAVYTEYIEPLDIPGPDQFIDPAIKTAIPVAIHGLHSVIKRAAPQ